MSTIQLTRTQRRQMQKLADRVDRVKFPASYEYETFDEDARAAREHAEYWDHEQYLEDAYLL